MIVTSTPLRISFFGGGSDIPDYYNKKGGMVISTTIDKQIQIALNRCEPNYIRAVYSEMEVVQNVNHLKHNRIKEALKIFNVDSNVEICSFSDVSTKGTGLGSSSTFTVGLLKALYNYKMQIHNKKDLAETACEIEIVKCNEPIGKQDQYAAAYGGFNVIRFDQSGVEVIPLDVSSSILCELNSNLMCFSTGMVRNTSDVLSDQTKNVNNDSVAFDNTSKLVDIAEFALKKIRDKKIEEFGSLLGEAWECKKKLSNKISNPEIDSMYEKAKKAGALGGKILGAGGGGYMLFYVPEQRRNAVSIAMKDYKKFEFNFVDEGSKCVML